MEITKENYILMMKKEFDILNYMDIKKIANETYDQVKKLKITDCKKELKIFTEYLGNTYNILMLQAAEYYIEDWKYKQYDERDEAFRFITDAIVEHATEEFQKMEDKKNYKQIVDIANDKYCQFMDKFNPMDMVKGTMCYKREDYELWELWEECEFFDEYSEEFGVPPPIDDKWYLNKYEKYYSDGKLIYIEKINIYDDDEEDNDKDKVIGTMEVSASHMKKQFLKKVKKMEGVNIKMEDADKAFERAIEKYLNGASIKDTLINEYCDLYNNAMRKKQ